MSRQTDSTHDREYLHWNRVYLAVILTLMIVIAALWIFSSMYE
jgi:hypothetical protein